MSVGNMIIKSKNTIEAFALAKDYLFSLPDAKDPELLKEGSLVIIFKDLSEDKSIPEYNEKVFNASFKYTDINPE
ncbi:MAG: hypothetical protein HY506_01110, partial [Candidatus Yanofskybacteria bacterium]|nr:hypothetical protein [Candidatus Yanofskybacteria bacterium]